MENEDKDNSDRQHILCVCLVLKGGCFVTNSFTVWEAFGFLS